MDSDKKTVEIIISMVFTHKIILENTVFMSRLVSSYSDGCIPDSIKLWSYFCIHTGAFDSKN